MMTKHEDVVYFPGDIMEAIGNTRLQYDYAAVGPVEGLLIATDGEWVACVHPPQDFTPNGWDDASAYKNAVLLLKDCQHFVSTMRPAQFLNLGKWLKGQLGGFAFRMDRQHYDAFVGPNDRPTLVLWRGNPGFAIVRKHHRYGHYVTAVIPVAATFDDRLKTVRQGVPQEVHDHLENITALSKQ
jgi:hypothetical protein